MPRPGRLYPNPMSQGSNVDLNLVNVNSIIGVQVFHQIPPTPGAPAPWTLALLQTGGGNLTVDFQSEAEALAAAEVWRTRIDDAP